MPNLIKKSWAVSTSKFIYCEKAIKFEKNLFLKSLSNVKQFGRFSQTVKAFSDYQSFTEPNSFPFSHIEGSSDANCHLRKLEAWVFLDNKMVKFSHYPALCSCSVCARKVWSSLKCKI